MKQSNCFNPRKEVDPMKSCEDTSLHGVWTKLVYLLVGLTFISFILPLGRVKEGYIAVSKEAATVTETEKEETRQICLQIIEFAKLKGEKYDPEAYLQDRATLLTLKDKFSRIKGFDSDSHTLQAMLRGVLGGLRNQALTNFSYSDLVSRSSKVISRQEMSKNYLRWQQAKKEVPHSRWDEPLISISFHGVSCLVKWLILTYLKFLPCSLFLIIFHILRRKLSVWQELTLRPLFFLGSILKGPVGIAIYSGIDPAFELRYTKARFRYMRENRKYSLSEAEEKALRLQAGETPGLIISKFAVIVSYLMMITLTPVLAISGGFNHKPAEQIKTQSDDVLSGEEEGTEEDESASRPVIMAEVVPFRVQPLYSTAPVARVEPGQQIVTCWVSRKWYLPPRLAPPLS